MNESDLTKRIADLEEQLARVKEERDMHKQTAQSFARIPPEWEKPLTQDEVEEMLKHPSAESFDSILAEYEHRND